MVDFQSFNASLFPKGIPSIESGKSDSVSTQPTGSQSASFQDQLMKALDQISEEADQVAQSSSLNYENVQQAMDQAKNVFSNTMQTHQMMQYFLMNSQKTQENIELSAPEESGE